MVVLGSALMFHPPAVHGLDGPCRKRDSLHAPVGKVSAMELKEIESQGRAALVAHLEGVLFDRMHPDGTTFRRDILDGDIGSEKAIKKRAEMLEAARAWTPDANWRRFDQPSRLTFGGRWGGLYTELRFEPGKPVVVFVEID